MQGLEVVKKNVGKSENICIYNEGFSIEFSFYIRNVNINTGVPSCVRFVQSVQKLLGNIIF